jgi:hypothetical protein
MQLVAMMGMLCGVTGTIHILLAGCFLVALSVAELSNFCLHMPDHWNRAAVFAYVMSTVSMLLTTLNTQSIRTQQQQRKLEGFCRSHHIPKPLATKLAGFYDFVLPRQVHSEDQEIIDALPSSLQQQVMRCSLLTACLCCESCVPSQAAIIPAGGIVDTCTGGSASSFNTIDCLRLQH